MKNTLRTTHRLTQSGVALLMSKLQSLEQERKSLVNRLRTVRNQQTTDMVAEDSIYIQTLSKLQFIETELYRIKDALATSEIIKVVTRRKQVEVGCSVTLKSENGDLTYTIVDSIEADPFNGRISHESPLGRLLLGKKLKDFITLPSKRKKLSVQLVGIE